MAKESKLNFILANNLPKKKQHESPKVIVSHQTTAEIPENKPSFSEIQELSDDSVTEETSPIPQPVPTIESHRRHSDSRSQRIPPDEPPQLDYNQFMVPLGSKDNGITLCIVLSTIIALALGFLIYHEYVWRIHEEESQVHVDSEFSTLTVVIKTYVSSIKDERKAEYCQKLYPVYIQASKSKEPLEQTIKQVIKQSREILGFDAVESQSNEFEWHKLFGVDGVIDTWMVDNGIKITDSNRKEFFKAVAQGLK